MDREFQCPICGKPRIDCEHSIEQMRVHVEKQRELSDLKKLIRKEVLAILVEQGLIPETRLKRG